MARLSRNFGKKAAFSAGLRLANGAAVVTIDTITTVKHGCRQHQMALLQAVELRLGGDHRVFVAAAQAGDTLLA